MPVYHPTCIERLLPKAALALSLVSCSQQRRAATHARSCPLQEVLAAPGGEQGLQRLLEIVILLAEQPSMQQDLGNDRQLTQLLKAAVSMGNKRPMLRR